MIDTRNSVYLILLCKFFVNNSINLKTGWGFVFRGGSFKIERLFRSIVIVMVVKFVNFLGAGWRLGIKSVRFH